MYLGDLVNYRLLDPPRRSQAAIALRAFPKHKVLPALRQAVMSEPVAGVATDISASINSFGDEELLDQFLNGRKFNSLGRERLASLFKRGNKTGLKVLKRLVRDPVASVRYQAYDGFIGEAPEIALSVLDRLPIDPEPKNEARRKALMNQFRDEVRKHQLRSFGTN